MTQLDNITKRPLLPVITIQKTSGVYTYNPFASTFDFRVGQLSFKPAFDAMGGTFSLQIYGNTGINSEMNTILSNISEGNEVTIWVGKTDASKVKKFLGIIETIEIFEPNKNTMMVTLSGPDWGSDILKNRVVNGQWDQRKTSGVLDTTDNSTTIAQIVDDLLNNTQSYPAGAADANTVVAQGIIYDVNTVIPIDYQLPTFSARFEFLDDKLQELDDLALSYHFVDPDKKFHMYQLDSATFGTADILFTDDINDTTTWTSGKVGLIAPNSTFKRTLEHHKRRVFGLGGLSSAVDQESTGTGSSQVLSAGYYAMRFTPTKSTLSNIMVWLSQIGTPTVDLTLELRADSSTGDSLPTGEVLRSISKPKAFLGGASSATPSPFEMNEELSPQQNYWIVLLKNGSDASNTFRWHHDGTDASTLSATSADDVTWAATTTPNRTNFAFQAYLGNDIIAVSTDPLASATSKHYHEDTIRKSDIVDNAVLKYLLTQENKTAHKKKEIITCQVYAPDTLLNTGQRIRVRKQTSGYVVDGEFTLGGLEYIFESSDDKADGALYYTCELTRFVDYN